MRGHLALFGKGAVMTTNDYKSWCEFMNQAAGSHSVTDELYKLAQESGSDELEGAIDEIARAYEQFAMALDKNLDTIESEVARLKGWDRRLNIPNEEPEEIQPRDDLRLNLCS